MAKRTVAIYATGMEKLNRETNTWTELMARKIGGEEYVSLAEMGVVLYNPGPGTIPMLEIPAEMNFGSCMLYDPVSHTVSGYYNIIHNSGGIQATEKSPIVRYKLATVIENDDLTVININDTYHYIILNARFNFNAFDVEFSTTIITSTTANVAVSFNMPAMSRDVSGDPYILLKSAFQNESAWRIRLSSPSGRQTTLFPGSVAVVGPLEDTDNYYGGNKTRVTVSFTGNFPISGLYVVEMEYIQESSNKINIPGNLAITVVLIKDYSSTTPMLLSLSSSVQLVINITTE